MEGEGVAVSSAMGVIINVMETFGESEPDEVIILYANQEGVLNLAANCDKWKIIGMLEATKARLLSGARGEEG